MPYLNTEDRKEADEHPEKAKKPGQLNYLYTKFFIKLWKDNPCYDTIHLIEYLVDRPEGNENCWKLTQMMKATNVTPTDINTARRRAVKEFDRRIANKYEESKRLKNGDVYKEFLENDTSVVTPKMTESPRLLTHSNRRRNK